MKGTILKRTFNDLKEDYELWIKNVTQILEKMQKKDALDRKKSGDGADSRILEGKSNSPKNGSKI